MSKRTGEFQIEAKRVGLLQRKVETRGRGKLDARGENGVEKGGRAVRQKGRCVLRR